MLMLAIEDNPRLGYSGIVVVLGCGRRNDAMWRMPQSLIK